MKKYPIIWMIIILSLAALACRIPFLGKLLEKPMISSKSLPTDTAVPQITASVTATEAASEPTITEQSKDVPPATALYQANGVELTLPDTFQLGDVDSSLDTLMDSLPSEAQPYEQMLLDFYAENKDDIILWAYDTENPTRNYTNLLIIRNEALAGIPLSMLTTFASALFDDALESVLNETITLGERETLRLVTNAQVNEDGNSQVIYLFQESGVLWILGFFTNQEDIESQMLTFDDAVSSFNILSSE